MLPPPAHQRHKVDWRDDQHRERERKDGEMRRLRAIARMKELEERSRVERQRLDLFNCLDRRHRVVSIVSTGAGSSRYCPTCQRPFF